MPRKHKEKVYREKETERIIWILYALIVLSVVGYALTSNVLIGIAAFFLVIVTLIFEFRYSVKQEGTKKSIYDVLIALAAVAVIWIILVAVLQTWSPVDVVASCSMLPNLHRGDLVILHGITNMTAFLKSHDIPVVNVSSSQFNQTVSNMNTEFLAYYAHSQGNRSQINNIINATNVPISLYNTQCLSTYAYLGQQSNFGKCYVSSQSQNLIQYNYSLERVNLSGRIENIIQTSNISIAGQRISENYNNPIIVYQTTSNDEFSGDIIHRLVAAVNSSGQYYLLTKGDNNPGLDIQYENYPIAQKDALGYVIADVPMLGYLKLIISGQLSTPEGCNSTIIR